LPLDSKTEHADKLRGLGAGGDDYITKPFHPEELMARIESAMRRRNKTAKNPNPAAAGANTLEKGALTLDIIAVRAFVDGVNMELPPKEFAVLLLLAQNEGKSVSSEQIYETVWKAQPVGYKNALKTVVSRLRDKMEATEFDIVTTRGADAGYMFTKS
jgi:DNA-binding response OmpR family regulator